MNKFLNYLCITILISMLIAMICYLIYVCVGVIERNPSKIIKQDSEWIWVRKYSLYNEDSCIYKYHQPIIHEGEVVNLRTNFAGVPGKGGHVVYRTDIQYNENEEYTETGWSYYNSHKEGDKVKLKETFYPSYNIEVLN